MSRYVFQLGIVGLAWLALPFSAQALNVQAVNYGGVIAASNTTTYYFPTTPGNGTCTPQTSLVSIDPARTPPAAINTDNTAAVGTLLNSVMTFTITSAVGSLTTIAGHTPLGAGGTDVSIRVETATGGSGASGVAVPLVVLDSHIYNGVDNTEIAYGNNEGEAVTFGVALRDLRVGDTVAGGAAVTTFSDGLCALLSNTHADAAAALAFCNPPGGTNPRPITLTFGLIAAGSAFHLLDAGSNADTNVKSNLPISIVFSDCPAGANAVVGPPKTFLKPTLNFSLVTGDQRIKLVNNTVPLSDSVVPVTGVVVEGNTQYPVSLNGTIQRVNTSVGGGVYTIDGLVNDIQYCFSLGYINAAGWVSTDANWTSQLQRPSPDQCATPSQIDGFLNRSTCFIASAAYGEEWDPRLETLRQFRDQILDHFAAGRAFTDWYYSWSPSAAHWLIENPSYRTFVRVLLMPTVEMARVSLWIRANMWVFGVMLLLGTAMAVTMRRRTT